MDVLTKEYCFAVFSVIVKCNNNVFSPPSVCGSNTRNRVCEFPAHIFGLQKNNSCDSGPLFSIEEPLNIECHRSCQISKYAHCKTLLVLKILNDLFTYYNASLAFRLRVHLNQQYGYWNYDLDLPFWITYTLTYTHLLNAKQQSQFGKEKKKKIDLLIKDLVKYLNAVWDNSFVYCCFTFIIIRWPLDVVS